MTGNNDDEQITTYDRDGVPYNEVWRTKSGKVITEAELIALAEEAERGYDVTAALIETGREQPAVDETEDLRRAEMAKTSAALADALEHDEQTWDTDQMRRDFEVLGFAAPFVVVQRRSDGAKGSLQFKHSPRVYFGWVEDR